MDKAVTLIAGAGPGLGAALGRRFAQGGMQVALLARDAGRLNAIAATIGPGAHAFPCDLTDAAAVQGVFERVDQELGPPQCLIFNAGAYRPGSVLDIRPQDFIECWRVGCLAGLLVAQQAARRMVAAASGSILFTGATASLRGSARFASLASPKFALRALAQSMARELGPLGVHVAHVIIDGGIRAPDRPPGDLPESQLEPDAIAQAYWQLHAQPRSAWTLELDLRPWVEKF